MRTRNRNLAGSGITRRTFLASVATAPLAAQTAFAQGQQTLWIFGARLEGDGSTWSGLPAGFRKVVVSGGQVEIDFNGPIPGGGHLEFTGKFPVRADANGVLRIMGGGGAARRLQSPFAPHAALDLGPPANGELGIVTAVAAPLEREGLGFVVRRSSYTADPTWMAFIRDAFGPKAKLEGNLTNWPARLVFTIDYGAGTKGQPQVVLKRLTADARQPVVTPLDMFERAGTLLRREHGQPLTLEELRCTGAAGEAVLRPTSGYYLVQGDILDPARADLADNDIVYEFALADGLLHVGWNHQLRWDGAGDDATLLAFRLTDENANPLAVRAASFALVRRDGITAELTAASTPAEREKTLAAVTLDGATTGRLSQIDPSAVPPLSRRSRKLDPPYWLRETPGGPRVLLRDAPAEIHGLNRGVYLRRRGSGPDLDCSVTTSRVETQPGTVIFALPHLGLKTADWDVVAYHASRDLYPQVSETVSSDAVSVCVASPVAGAKEWFAIPLIDTSYAVANMAGASRGQQQIARATATWLRQLDAQFTSSDWFKPSRPARSTHSDGFEVDAPEPAFHALLALPPAVATTLETTMGEGARTRSAVSTYVHGGARVPSTAGNLESALSAGAAPQYEAAWKVFREFWTGQGNFSSDALLARETLREYLQSQIVESPSAKFFKDAVPRIAAALASLEHRLKTTLSAVRTAVSGVTAETLETLWTSPKPPKNVIPEQWAAFRRELSWPAFSANLKPDFFADAVLRAIDLVNNLADVIDPEFSTLRNFVTPGMSGPNLESVWLTAPVDPVVWRRLTEYLVQPPSPSLFRRALQVLYSRPVSGFAVPDPFTAPPPVTNLTLDVEGKSASIAAFATLQELADRANDALTTLGFTETVRAYTVQLEDGAYHLAFDTTGPQAVSLLSDGQEQLQALPPLLASSSGVIGQLRERIRPFTTRFDSDYFNDPVQGFLSRVSEGVDALFARLEDLWAKAPGAAWEALRAKYSPALTQDVYERLLANAADAQEVVNLFNVGAPQAIRRLSDLRSEPPPYLFFTRKFELRQATANPEQEWPWRRSFDLCALAAKPGPAKKNWTFFLDDVDSSVIVKLTNDRSLRDILREVHRQYRAPERQNPLNVPGREGESPDEMVEHFAGRLDPALLEPQWRGLLIIRPIADISKDRQLADLCGFAHIGAEYAAIGGHDLQNSALDVYALIAKEQTPEEPSRKTDVALTVEKFEARIRHSELVGGEVILHFDPRNVWGKDLTGQSLRIRGTVAKEAKTAGVDAKTGEGEPSSFEFAAALEPPKTIPIGIAFLESLTLRSVRVGRSRGQTSLDIDASAQLKPVSLGPYRVGESSILNLRNFRVLLPRTSGGKAAPIGRPRLLDFEFPAITFDFPDVKPFSLAGLNLKPIGLGIFRAGGLSPDLLGNRYQWIGTAPSFAKNLDFSFLRCRVEFGELPQLGLAQIGSLDLEVLIGFYAQNGHASDPVFAIGGLDARDLRFDLFRILKLEIQELLLKEAKVGSATGASAFLVKNARLSILDWPVLGPNGSFSLLLLHDQSGRKHATAAAINGPIDAGFVQLDWALVTNGIQVDPAILSRLLEPKHSETDNPVNQFINAEATPATVAADFEESARWLVGASFRLGKVIDRAAFLLHDQHYYGISLTAAWMEEVLGSERLTLAYMPGARREQDRFRTSFRLPALNFIAGMKGGEIAVEWGVNWDVLLDFGFPWKGSGGYQWERSFSVPAGTYEAKFGFYFEKKSEVVEGAADEVSLSAGVGLYVGYRWEVNAGIAWARAGIGVFAVLQGTVVMLRQTTALLGSVKSLTVTGVIGIYAYGEGGVDVWILSARFTVSVQASLAGTLNYIPNGASSLAYEAMLAAHYSASCRVGCDPFSWEFSVSGAVQIGVSGRVALT